jgi:hypothetical protein
MKIDKATFDATIALLAELPAKVSFNAIKKLGETWSANEAGEIDNALLEELVTIFGDMPVKMAFQVVTSLLNAKNQNAIAIAMGAMSANGTTNENNRTEGARP